MYGTMRKIEALRARPGLVALLRWINRLITGGCYCGFCALCLWLLLRWDVRLIRVLLIDGSAFFVMSAVRKKINAPRPYEVLGIRPLIPKQTRGCSFPSRHIFSIFLLAVTFGWFCPAAGIVCAVCGVPLALIRVYTAVHFPRDVIAGALLGAAIGFLGFYVF